MIWASNRSLDDQQPKKIAGLSGYGLEIVERVPLKMQANPNDAFYLQTKKDKMDHML